MSKLQLKVGMIEVRKDSIMKIQFNIKAAIWGGLGFLLATALIVIGVITLYDIEEDVRAQGVAFILCGLSFVSGMLWFGMKTVSEKDKNQGG